MKGYEYPLLKTPVPGPLSKMWIKRATSVEAPNITYEDEKFPIFIKSAFMNNVWDVDDNRFVDLTSFLGVALLGHRHPKIQKIIQEAEIYHGMGDVHPSPNKIILLEKINNLLGGNFMGIFAQSGSEAVETCLKTQLLYTKKPGVIVFDGAYHGLGMGTLNLTQRGYFKEGLHEYLTIPVYKVPFPHNNEEEVLNTILNIIKQNNIGLLFTEPIQGRGGVRIFNADFLKKLREITQNYNILLGFDEIFTGSFRTGYFSLAREWDIDFDLITLGKALSCQFPLSVCMGKKKIMEAAWPQSHGEAKHTYTFLGHPLFTKVALNILETIEREKLNVKIQTMGNTFLNILKEKLNRKKSIVDIRGKGLMIGMELRENTFPLSKSLLQKGYITLPAGKNGNVLEIIPPVSISNELFKRFAEVLSELTR